MCTKYLKTTFETVFNKKKLASFIYSVEIPKKNTTLKMKDVH